LNPDAGENQTTTKTTMREQIEVALKVLVGKKLWKCTRAADMACFQFGQRRKVQNRQGKKVEIGEYALHVECAWRIAKKDRVIVGRQDLYYPADYKEGSIYPENFDWDHDPNRHDKLLTSFFKSGNRKFEVKRIDVAEAGSFQIRLADGFSLEVFPFNSLKDEHWRLFEPRLSKRHFVCSGNGINK
jgi:hypothetical protein